MLIGFLRARLFRLWLLFVYQTIMILHMITQPNYLEIIGGSGELLPHVQRLEQDGSIDAIVVRGGIERLNSEQLAELSTGIISERYSRPDDKTLNFARTLIKMMVPDINELTQYISEVASTQLFDFLYEPANRVLKVDEIRTSGMKSYAHIDLPSGPDRSQIESVRAVSSLSIGTGTKKGLFLSKRLPSFKREGDTYHQFITDYLNAEVEEVEDGGFIHREGWSIEQFPGDIVIFPQFDRPAIHQVESQIGRSSVVYSTWITSRYAALTNLQVANA